jgi:hypothetical protein
MKQRQTKKQQPQQAARDDAYISGLLKPSTSTDPNVVRFQNENRAGNIDRVLSMVAAGEFTLDAATVEQLQQARARYLKENA